MRFHLEVETVAFIKEWGKKTKESAMIIWQFRKEDDIVGRPRRGKAKNQRTKGDGTMEEKAKNDG